MGLSDFLRSASDVAVGKVNDLLKSESTAGKVAAAEDWLTEQRMSVKAGTDSFRGRRLLVYRGYAYGTTVKVLVRAVESARVPDDSSIPYWQVVKTNVRRHWMLSLPGVEVEAEVNGTRVTGIADRHGFVPLTIEVPQLEAGWHEVSCRIVPADEGEEEVAEKGSVVKPDPRSPFAVVSDIDDTVIKSGLTEGLTAARRTLLGDQHTRVAIPGMSSFYRGLQRGVTEPGRRTRHPEPTWFYLSTGTWSFYEMLAQFLQLRGFPRGPLFLTDWGPSERYLHRSGAMHKQHTLTRLFDAYPQLRFVLIGDAGQADFGAYAAIARQYPEQVTAIFIVPVNDAERVAKLQAEAVPLRDQGIPMHVVESVTEAAIIARDLGLCDELTVEEVQTELGAVF